jgi:hypothetical protein
MAISRANIRKIQDEFLSVQTIMRHFKRQMVQSERVPIGQIWDNFKHIKLTEYNSTWVHLVHMKKKELFVLFEKQLKTKEGKTKLENIHFTTNEIKEKWMLKIADEGLRRKRIFTKRH